MPVLTIVRRVLIAATLVVILLVPLRGGNAPVVTKGSDIDVLVVVDTTRSMAALDYGDGEPRWNGVEQDLPALAEALPGARFGLLTYGADADLVLPFTTDTAAFTSAVETTFVESVFFSAGSRIDRPVYEVTTTLERAAELDPDRRRFVVFVSDGEDTDEGQPAPYDEVGDLIAGGAVLGYGTEEGARMPEADDMSTDQGYVYDYQELTDAISRADPENLADLADELDVDYVHRTTPGGMDEVAADFRSTPSNDGTSGSGQRDLVWIAGLVLVLLLLWELYVAARAWTLASEALRAVPGQGGPR
ncbi:Ca-activated chloride channel family protein [Nocardioides thalensis]|uniref:Ca-activated chloride channel family protein n=1 Tax=Nocardioides thalensis TaxID=1914755 RepID=A0A853BZ30_9ACTN|nr:vWA domain-containing protein [Nocardioides thalensis]NYJ00117.1 Ca-activated chloride channel family protein [Nocardioides thalensis]